jgi:hypothetical protein
MTRKLLLLSILIVSPVLVSCNRDRTAAYMPEESKARAILTSALEAWKAGHPYGQAIASKPQIEVFEARWQEGEKLDMFEILDQVPGLTPPQFRVRMQLTEKLIETTDYVVVGIDPMLVFREADYIRATGM